MSKQNKRQSIFMAIVLICCMGVLMLRATSVDAATRALSYKQKTIEQTKTFSLKVKNAAKSDKIKFTSDNVAIAKVSSKGVVTGVSTGETTIRVKVTDKNKKIKNFQCKVTVTPLYIPIISQVALVQDGDMVLDAKGNIGLTFAIDKNTNAVVRVCNSSDEVVYTKKLTVKKNKQNTIYWDGKKNTGADNYYFMVTADTAEIKSNFFYVYETSEFDQGTGSSKNPYAVSNLEQFKKIVAHNGCSFYLKNDIDLEFGSLGGLFSEDQPFNGTFDGKGHTLSNILNSSAIFTAVGENGTIKNLNVDNLSKSQVDCGMFVQVNRGTIEKCNITNASSGSGQTGILAYKNFGTIKNCETSGSIGNKGRYHEAGGVVVINESTGKIINCTSSVDINLSGEGGWTHNLGGIAAINKGLIVSCNASGNYSSSRYSSLHLGAIAGVNEGTIQSSYYTGSQADLKIAGSGSGVIN